MELVQPRNIADARAAIRHVFVRDLELKCSIGVHSHEKDAPQRVLINLDLAVREGETNGQLNDDIENVVCYEALTNGVREIVADGHVNLVETLAEEITGRVAVPTIGIGASSRCDGQILVTDDLLGLFPDFTPPFVRQYAELAGTVRSAVSAYGEDVRARRFPGPEHVYAAGDGKA